MIPAPNYSHLNKMLNFPSFKIGRAYVEGIPDGTKLLGFVFFSQNYHSEPVNDFIQNINLLNLHSAKYIHFLLPGVSEFGPNEGDDSTELGILDGGRLYYNPRAFFSFKEAFEEKIGGWHFDYGMDLVLLNVVGNVPEREIDFCNSVYFKIDELINAGIFDRSSQLIGKVIKFSRENNLRNVGEIQSMLELNFGANWFKAFILGMFPKSLQKLARSTAVLGGGRAVKTH